MTPKERIEEILGKVQGDCSETCGAMKIADAKQALLTAILEGLPNEGLERGVMPYQQGLIDGRKQALSDVCTKIKGMFDAKGNVPIWNEEGNSNEDDANR